MTGQLSITHLNLVGAKRRIHTNWPVVAILGEEAALFTGLGYHDKRPALIISFLVHDEVFWFVGYHPLDTLALVGMALPLGRVDLVAHVPAEN